MANQNSGPFAGSVDDFSFDGYSTDTSMASQQTITAIPAFKRAAEVEWNPTVGFHMKVDFATYHQHPTQGYYYVPVPAPADAPTSTLFATTPVVPDAHMYEQIDENFGIDPYAFQDPTQFDPMAYEDPMASGYAEVYPDTAYPALQNTPDYGPESDSTSTPRTQLAKKQGKLLQQIQKHQLKYPPKQQRGAYKPRKQSVIRTCTCAHNRTDSLKKVKRPENSFIIFRKTPVSEHVPVVQKLYDQVRVELGYQKEGEQSRSVAAGKVWSTMKEDVEQNGPNSMFKATYDSFLKKAIVAKRKHEAEYPGYVYAPNAAAVLDFGNEDCTCGAREYNLKMKEEREMMKEFGSSAQIINWSARLPKSARPSLKSKSKSKKKDDDSDDDLSDVPSDFGDDDSDEEEEVVRTPRKSQAMKRYESMEISSPTPSRRSARSTRGVKTPSVQTTSKKTVIPTKWKGYALEVVEDEDVDVDME